MVALALSDEQRLIFVRVVKMEWTVCMKVDGLVKITDENV